MYLYFICFFCALCSCFASPEFQERKARFNARARQKIALEEDTMDALDGFFLEASLGTASLRSSKTDLSYERNGSVFSDVQISPVNPVDFTWNIGAGWMFHGYASLFAAYENRQFLLSFFTSPVASTSSETIFPQQGYGKVELHVGFFGAKLLFPKMLGIKSPAFVPFVGAEVGYAEKKLQKICLQDLSGAMGRQELQSSRKGGIAYKVLLGSYFFLQKQVLMNVAWSYADMGAVKPKSAFIRREKGKANELLVFTERPKVKLRSFALIIGCTFVI